MKNIYVQMTPEFEEEIRKIKENNSYQSNEELYQHLIQIGLKKIQEHGNRVQEAK